MDVNHSPVAATSPKPAPATANGAATLVPDGAPSEEPTAAAQWLFGSLQSALHVRDFLRMSQLWKEWQKRRLKTPQLYARCSSLIRRAVRTSPDGLTPPQHTGLDKLAVHAAALGDLSGITARMAYYLQHKQPDAVLNLANEFNAAITPPGAGRKTGRSKVTVPGPGASATAMTKIKAYTVVACVMKDTFESLLPLLTLGATGTLELHSLLFWTATIADAFSVSKETATSWAKRYHTLSVVSLPLPSYKAFVGLLVEAELGGQGAPIEMFATNIVRELRRENGPLRLNLSNEPMAADSETPIVEFTVDRCAHLMGMLIRSGNEEATRVFDEGMAHIAPPTVPPAVHAAVLAGLAKVGRFDEAQRTWETIGPEARTADVYDAYIAGLVQSGKREEALAQFEAFEKLYRNTEGARGPAATAVFNQAILCLADSGRIADAQAVLGRMKAQGPAPDVSSYNNVLRGHVRQRDTAAVLAVLREMDARGVRDDLGTAALVLTALHPARADAPAFVLRRLRRGGVRTTPRTCIALFTQHLAELRSDAALDAAAALLAHLDAVPALRPTADTFAAVLYAAERHAWADGARGTRMRAELRAAMAQRGLALGHAHVRLLVSACRRNGAGEALGRAMDYYREHRTAARGVNYRVWTALMGELVRRKEWSLADEIVYDVSSEAASDRMRELVGRVLKRDPTWKPEAKPEAGTEK